MTTKEKVQLIHVILSYSVNSTISYVMGTLPPISHLNQLDESHFFEIVHLLFETAPPLSKALSKRRPYSSYEELIDISQEEIEKMNLTDKIEVINAHPRIGLDPSSFLK